MEQVKIDALMQRINSAEGLPDPNSFTSEEWTYLQEIGLATASEDSVHIVHDELLKRQRANALMDTYMKRKYGGEPNASYLDAYAKTAQYTQEYKMSRAQKAGKGWLGYMFWLGIFALIGWILA